MKLKKIFIASIILTIFITIIFIQHNQFNKLKNDYENNIKKGNKWWEMILKDCGRGEQKDKNNDYCRGFSNGYDYGIQTIKMDCKIKEWEENFNPNL